MQELADLGIMKRLSDVTFAGAIPYSTDPDLRDNMSLQLSAQYTILLSATFDWIRARDLITFMKHAPLLRHLEVTELAVELDGPGLFNTVATVVPLLESLRIQRFQQVIAQRNTTAQAVEQAAVDMVLHLRCLRELTIKSYNVQRSEGTRTYDLSKGAVSTSMRILTLGRVFHDDCIGALMQVTIHLCNAYSRFVPFATLLYKQLTDMKC
jgi:hypothetical protein